MTYLPQTHVNMKYNTGEYETRQNEENEANSLKDN